MAEHPQIETAKNKQTPNCISDDICKLRWAYTHRIPIGGYQQLNLIVA
jgi:hypothetical protein